MTSKTYEATLHRDGSVCFIPVPFDPKAVFGKIRAPVMVTLNGYSYQSTIAAMGGVTCIPFRRSHRKAAGLEGSETLEVRLDLDLTDRAVAPPDALAALMTADDREAWARLSVTRQKEHAEMIDGARRTETRARRIEATIAALRR